MLYVICQGHADYWGGQAPIVHLVSSVQPIVDSGRSWAFTDRHADLGYAEQFDRLEDLGRVDWSVMGRRQWGGDTDVKEKRQAEFLVHDWCPWTAIHSMGVIDQAMADGVAAVIAPAAHRPEITVRPDWYY